MFFPYVPYVIYVSYFILEGLSIETTKTFIIKPSRLIILVKMKI